MGDLEEMGKREMNAKAIENQIRAISSEESNLLSLFIYKHYSLDVK